jgi:LacI family transcriptional regulator
VTTLADIAKKAGVSYSTVSRALADSSLVNRETKERILRLADESGYQVNHLARSLATRTSYTLGLVVPETVDRR